MGASYIYSGGTVTIESLAEGGFGVARHRGKVVFIPDAVPGDVVFFSAVEDKKSYIRGRLEELLTPSPHRTDPFCPHAGVCGGCQWQHISYPMQLNAKQRIVTDALERIAGIEGVHVPPVAPSSSLRGWRVVLEMQCEAGPRGQQVGFFARKSRRIIKVQECPVAFPALSSRIAGAGAALSALKFHGRGELRLLAGEGDRVVALLTLSGGFIPGEKAVRAAMRRLDVSGLVLANRSGCRTFGDPLVVYPGSSTAPGGAISFSANGFVQANPDVNRKLIDHLLSHDISEKTVLELFSGGGNFTLPLAAGGARVTAVERDETLSARAEKTLQSLGAQHSQVVTADAAHYLTDAVEQGEQFDVVVLDPPRTGAHDVARLLPSLGAEEIFYISCAPATLARDVRILMDHGFRLESASVFDMFPHTFHVETLARLVRKGDADDRSD
ncbi:MAG: 23S rRNA (uracil(1939)-C(5))-methyltransferase RlmD [Deltaproteobacteria bacterium]|nr:23S rRNA (uracil(1939)-C(5))-methyltransferase RlmD [Candidatus Zymogenaceae bacterium]